MAEPQPPTYSTRTRICIHCTLTPAPLLHWHDSVPVVPPLLAVGGPHAARLDRAVVAHHSADLALHERAVERVAKVVVHSAQRHLQMPRQCVRG
jgi:hypothetical protein